MNYGNEVQFSSLKQGSTGPAVSSLQAMLTGAGFPVKIDGIFGPETKNAVMTFQMTMGTNASPSGVYDLPTAVALSAIQPVQGVSVAPGKTATTIAPVPTVYVTPMLTPGQVTAPTDSGQQYGPDAPLAVAASKRQPWWNYAIPAFIGVAGVVALFVALKARKSPAMAEYRRTRKSRR